ncbi:MAG: chromosome segregation protein SMC [Clostridium sp.]|uniref:chromosome segregation protein SMC n=1 Tax=Clostridium sp. TaxID=1506 RepID=UPI002FC642FA
MYLKKIEVKGFKSFADKIELDFEKGITAVVGPNGSGKSNIADAIKWVLGEQSAKSLRGGKMEDVIFAGTQKRGALGFAEVTLVIDNADGLIDFEYSEITVKRRLYRTGESEYYINGTQCRLKDILEVFMDTGIGKDGYSLIGQGKIEEILSTRSEDRRHLFEEAAGIVKYKWRKNEAERRLENTRQNLLRVDDIIEELENQIEPLKKQSESARKFLSLRDSLKSAEINLIAHNYGELLERLKKLKAEEASLKNTKSQYEEKKLELTLQYETLKEEIKSIEESFSETNKNMNEMEKNFEGKQGNLKLLNERHDNLVKEKERIKEEIEEEKSTIKNIISSTKEYKNLLSVEKLKFKEIEDKLLSEENEFNATYQDFNESEKLIDSKKADSIQILKDLSGVSNRENSSEINIKNLENRKTQIEREKSIKLERKNALLNEIKEMNENLNEIEEELNSSKASIESSKLSLVEYENTLSSLNRERSGIYDALKQREAKYSALSAMENDMEGFSRAVKSVMKRYTDREKVFGTINEIISVPKGFEIAIETTLSGALQNIVVKDEDIAKNAIEYLKSNKLGRATFYPLTVIKSRESFIKENIKSIKGFKGIASDIVEYDKVFSNVVKNLLSRVIICDNLVAAREIAKATDYSFRIVTLEGDVINSGGSYTGGSSNLKNSGLISRKNTILTLEEEIKSYKDKLSNVEGSIEDIKCIIKSSNESIASIQERYQEVLSRFNSEKSKIVLTKSNIELSEEDIKDLNIEGEHIEIEVSKNKEFLKSVSTEKEKLLAMQKELDSEIELLTGKHREKGVVKEEVQERITKVKINLTEVKKSIEGIEDKIESLDREKATHERRINIFSSKINDMESTIVATQDETKKIIIEIQNISTTVITMKNKIYEVEQSKKESSEKREFIETSLSKTEESITSLIESIHKFEIQTSKLEIEIEGLKSKLWEDYEYTIPEALNAKVPIESIKDEIKKVQDIKGEIKTLGNININAIEEYKKVVERYEFLTTQKEDLQNAESSLMEVIEEMTVKMREQFVDRFKIMRENFSATFKELFGGGYADLKMEGDDPLTSGIDIIVQPPGKKLQSLTLLSGGEKGLSAIALVFAILKMKPTPFCVLDEIEAALDDANVNRYAKFLKEYARNTQFIIITHRKGSMAAADCLYGVTMEEKGVSKMISLKLEGGK